MTIAQLKYALAVEKYLNFSKAAEMLYISQPALSAQIKSLESELKLTLFTRSSQGVNLTASGKDFCQEASLIVSAWDKFERKFNAGRQDTQTQLRIGIGFRALSTGIFSKLVKFYNSQADTEVLFVSIELNDNPLEFLLQNQIDFVIDRLPPSPIRQTIDLNCFTLVELLRERQCAVISPDLPLGARTSLTFSDLRGCKLITGPKGSIDDLAMQKLCRDYDLGADNLYRTNGLNVMVDLIRKGEGITIGPESLSNYFHVATIPIVPEKYIPLYLMCLKQKAHAPAFLVLKEHLFSLLTPGDPLHGNGR